MAKLAIKSDRAKQNLLLPPSLDELIPSTHIVRVVSEVIDFLDIKDILSTYKGGGNSAFNPKTMLKILVYAYLCNIYSSRKIAQQLCENINLMWLSGMSRPDYRTINYFRSKRLKDSFESIFTQVVELLHSQGFISLNVQYIDGTKLESSSNKYTFVWRGSVEKNDARLKAKTKALLQQIESNRLQEDEQLPYSDDMNAEDFSERLDNIKQHINDEELSKSDKKSLQTIEEEYIPRMERYAQQLSTMGDRNSYSKTDPDATFMRMKEDAMLNGQLKPGYNVQISTENQFITNYDIFQRPTDTLTLIPYLQSFMSRYGRSSSEIVADSGYGSEENYEYMLMNGMTPFVKYNMFHVEQRRKYQNNAFLVSNLFYNAQEDFYVCPMGQKLSFKKTEQRKTASGFIQTVSVYCATRCQGCPLRGQCHKSKNNRRIEVNHTLEEYKAIARKLLMSERGLMHRSYRPIEPEAVFGQIKQNGNFRRLRLKGMTGAKIEFGLKALAHNVAKLAQQRANSPFFIFFSENVWCFCQNTFLPAPFYRIENKNTKVLHEFVYRQQKRAA